MTPLPLLRRRQRGLLSFPGRPPLPAARCFFSDGCSAALSFPPASARRAMLLLRRLQGGPLSFPPRLPLPAALFSSDGCRAALSFPPASARRAGFSSDGCGAALPCPGRGSAEGTPPSGLRGDGRTRGSLARGWHALPGRLPLPPRPRGGRRPRAALPAPSCPPRWTGRRPRSRPRARRAHRQPPARPHPASPDSSSPWRASAEGPRDAPSRGLPQPAARAGTRALPLGTVSPCWHGSLTLSSRRTGNHTRHERNGWTRPQTVKTHCFRIN